MPWPDTCQCNQHGLLALHKMRQKGQALPSNMYMLVTVVMRSSVIR